MPASIFAVVYGTASKACRRVVVADTDAEVQAAEARLAPGESIVFLNHADHPTDKRIRVCMADIAARIAPGGQSVLPMRSAVVQGGVVVDLLMADGAVDTPRHVGGQFIQHDTVGLGARWNGSFFTNRIVFSDTNGVASPPSANDPRLAGEVLYLPSPQRSV